MRLAVERVKLQNRIESIRKQESGDDADVDDVPGDAESAADEALQSPEGAAKTKEGHMSRAQQADIMRAVVLAKSKEMRTLQETEALEKAATAKFKK